MSRSPGSHGVAAEDRPFWPVFMAFLRRLVSVMATKVALTIALAVAQSFGEGLGFLLLVPLLGAVGLNIGGRGVGGLAESVQSAFSWLGLQPSLGPALVAYAAVATSQALVTRAHTMSIIGVEQGFVSALRKRLYAAITHSTWLHLATRRASDLDHSLTQEMERVGIVTHQVLGLVSTSLIACVYLIVAVRVSPAMSVAVIGVGAVLLSALQGRKPVVRLEGEAVARARARLFTTVLEHIGALRIIKSHAFEQRHIETFAAAADDFAHAHVRAVAIHAGSRAGFEAGAAGALALMLYLGLVWFRLSPAGVLLLMYIFVRTMPRLSALQQAGQNVAHYLASFESIERVLTAAEAEAERVGSTSVDVDFSHAITFERVSFRYPSGEGIRDLTLEIPRGKLTAVVGPSGAGKSTLADLLIGLQRPQSGRILVDGTPLDRETLLAWKRQVGYVDQDSFVFNDTVLANLMWANPDATDDNLREALALAAAGFAFDLPDGVDTRLGDRGVRLSGGERQRLALARALLRKPRLLVLDEATSSLDSKNETHILDTIRRLRGRLTVVMITHRLGAVRDADAIHVLEDGRVVESGDWSTLNAREDSRFRLLWRAQDGMRSSPAAVV